MSTNDNNHGDDVTRRDMLHVGATVVGTVGAAAAVWPFIHQMNPAADTLALASVEVDISALEEGQAMIVKWRGKPVFVRHRTPAEIADAKSVKVEDLVDPQTDDERVQKDKWLVMIGVCTHLGCVPSGTKSGSKQGDFGGWFCPCHGSHYDTAGRIRKGPAPKNLAIPEYTFLSDTKLKIG